MTITAKYASRCATCGQSITPGQQIEWERGSKVLRHTSCEAPDRLTTYLSDRATLGAEAHDATLRGQVPTPATTAPAVTYETVGARVYVLGQTYAIRDAIRDAGGHWDADRKAWWIGTAKRASLEQAIATATPTASESRVYRPTTCKECGARADRYRKIYRNGVCGDCYGDYVHGGQSYYDPPWEFCPRQRRLGGDDESHHPRARQWVLRRRRLCH